MFRHFTEDKYAIYKTISFKRQIEQLPYIKFMFVAVLQQVKAFENGRIFPHLFNLTVNIQDEKYKHISKTYESSDMESMFFWEHIDDCLEADKNILTAVNVLVHAKDGGHANFVIIETCPERKHIRVIIFDPHAFNSKSLRANKETWESVLKTMVKSKIIKSYEVFTPFLNTSIQKTEGICLHWAVIIGLTFLLSEHALSGRLDTFLTRMLSAIQLRKEIIMTTYLFWIYSIHDEVITQCVEWPEKGEIDSTRLFNVENVLTTQFKANPQPDVYKLESSSNQCVFDLSFCSHFQNQSSCDHRKPPCEWDTACSSCYNSRLFDSYRASNVNQCPEVKDWFEYDVPHQPLYKRRVDNALSLICKKLPPVLDQRKRVVQPVVAPVIAPVVAPMGAQEEKVEPLIASD